VQQGGGGGRAAARRAEAAAAVVASRISRPRIMICSDTVTARAAARDVSGLGPQAPLLQPEIKARLSRISSAVVSTRNATVAVGPVTRRLRDNAPRARRACD
jgi:hypothetical protein